VRRWPSINEVVLVPATIFWAIRQWRKDVRERKRDEAARARRKAEVIQFASKAATNATREPE